jgi:hypothetical protein
MKIKTLSMLTGLGVPLIATGAARAAFLGVSSTAKPNPYGLFTVNVYAEFDNPGGDQFYAVGGIPGWPMNITVIGGTFYNHTLGSDQAPGTALVNAFPSLAYDSFYTIGRKVIDPPGGSTNALNLVNMPLLAGTSVHTTNGSYGLVPPTSPQGNPFDPINSFPGNGSVLIGQFSMEVPQLPYYGITGEFAIKWIADGQTHEGYAAFSEIVPAPGALGLIGLAGLTCSRRRRR